MDEKNIEKVVGEVSSTKEKIDWARKFSSRKFIMSLAGVISGIIGLFNFNDNITATIAFIALEVLSIVGYIIAEGKVDHAAAKSSVDLIKQVIDIMAAFMDNNPDNDVPPQNDVTEDLRNSLD